MHKNRLSALVVVDPAAQYRVVGIVTDRDYISFTRGGGGGDKNDETTTPVEAIMTPESELKTLSYTDTEEDAQRLMSDFEIRHLPVLHNGKLHGVLTFSDFVGRPGIFTSRTLRALYAEENREVFTDDYSFTLAEDVADRLKEELNERLAEAGDDAPATSAAKKP